MLCDGAGSCPHSERAAQRLTEWLPGYLDAQFDQLHALLPMQAAAHLAAAGQASLSVLGMPPQDCYCTLLFYAVHRDGRWLCGHIGDGYIFRVEQGAAEVLSGPENGRTTSETYFLSEPNAAAHLRITGGVLQEPCAVLLTSDGGGDTLYDLREQQPAPAVARLCGWLADNEETEVTAALAQLLQTRMIPATDDDASVAILWCEPE